MLVVSDASPLNILICIKQAHTLGLLFEAIIVPPAVRIELDHASTPAVVRDWINHPPAWLHVRAPTNVDETLALGAGEREAIALVREIGGDLLLVDDLKARRTAVRLGVSIIGTIGILELASERRLLDLPTAISDLRRTTFFASEAVIDEALMRDGLRRASMDSNQAQEDA